MAEIRRGIGADNRVERLPWLEPVEDEDGDPGADAGRGWIVAGIGLLAVIVLLIVVVVAFRHWRGAREDLGGIIRAPTTPYKVRPLDAGGLAVDTSGAVAEQTGTGAEIDAPLALVAPEQPIVGPGSGHAGDAAPAQPASTPPAKAPAVLLPSPPAATAPVAAHAVELGTMGGGTVQLGAFASEAKARAAWKSLSKRFAYLQAMTVSITPFETEGTTVYRLRASGGEPAPRVCARLQVADEVCAVVG